MQFLPNVTEKSLANTATSTLLGGLSSTSSSDAFGAVFDSMFSASETAARSVLDELTAAPSTVSTASTSGKDAYPTSTSEALGGGADLRVSEEDFADLREDLRGYGLDESDLDELEDKVASDEGMTWRELMSEVSAMADENASTGGADLDEESRRLITGFLDRIGCTDGETKELLAEMDDDNLDPVWEKIAEKLALLPADATVTISKDELSALAKGFNIPGMDEASLTAMFQGGGKAELDVNGLRTVLLMLKQASAAANRHLEENAAKGEASMREKLLEAVRNAMSRAERDELADNRETKDVAQAKVRIKDAAEDNHGLAAKRFTKPESGDVESKGLAVGKASEKASGDHAATGAAETADAAERLRQKTNDALLGKSDARAEEAAKSLGKQDGGKVDGDGDANRLNPGALAANTARAGEAGQASGQNGAGSQGQDSSRHDAEWRAFMNKVQVDNSAAGRPSDLYASLRMESLNLAANGGAQAAQAAQQAAQQAANTMHRAESAMRQEALPRQAMQSVETAMLKNLSQGRQQLHLRLDPPTLGRVTVMLTMHKNEVSAVIRPERHETGQLLAEQMQQLRQTLEQQGLKVQKLDVQTQTNADASAQEWMGADSHNAAREQDARRQALETWKSLHGGERGDVMAQEMQSSGKAAENSQSGLHIIA